MYRFTIEKFMQGKNEYYRIRDNVTGKLVSWNKETVWNNYHSAVSYANRCNEQNTEKPLHQAYMNPVKGMC